MHRIWWLMAPALLILAAPAQARPRDDALSSAIRCGVIADSRQWLDCYYGAAQPVRAGLGLGSALPAQIALAASPPSGGPPRDEAVRAEVVSAAANCMRLSDERPWLDCFYAAATPMRAQLGLSRPQGAARAAPVPAPVPLPRFATAAPPPAPAAKPAGPPPMPRPVSLMSGIFGKPRPVVVKVPMQSYEMDKNGSFTITLVDGQVWEQIAEDEIYHRARWRKPASEMAVTITPDAMHTFIMTVSGENYMYKVHRTR